MPERDMPDMIKVLLSYGCMDESDVLQTLDGFFVVNKSLSDILAEKNVLDFPDVSGERLACNRFFDDWFLYAVVHEEEYTYSLLKLREQEHDARDGSPADGDTPGVTISFVPFACKMLLDCLAVPTDENRKKLSDEINRVVAYRGQSHHAALKKYFTDPQSCGSYLVAAIYARRIAAYSEDGCLDVPERYKAIVQRSVSYKNANRLSRLPRFIRTLNQAAGHMICDNERIYFENPKELTAYEALAILATHTGNTSLYSFAAEVEYHARFLTPLAKLKIPFFGRSIYDSAIRADMTVGDAGFEVPVPFYQTNSKIVRRQYALHRDELYFSTGDMAFSQAK